MLEDQSIYVLYKDKVIAISVLFEDNKTADKEKKIVELLNKREYVPIKVSKPPQDHPWRKIIDMEIKLQQNRKALLTSKGNMKSTAINE